MKLKKLKQDDSTTFAMVHLHEINWTHERRIFKRKFEGVAAFIPPVRCWYCGCEMRKNTTGPGAGKHLHTKDHVIPRSRGGVSHRDNLVDACMGCNSRKSNLSVEQFRQKFKLGTFYGEYIQHVQTLREENQQDSGYDSDPLRGYSQYRQVSSNGSTGTPDSGRL